MAITLARPSSRRHHVFPPLIHRCTAAESAAMPSARSPGISCEPGITTARDRPRRGQRAGDPVLRLGGLGAGRVMQRYGRDADGAGWHDGLLMDLLAEDLDL